MLNSKLSLFLAYWFFTCYVFMAIVISGAHPALAFAFKNTCKLCRQASQWNSMLFVQDALHDDDAAQLIMYQVVLVS